MVDKLSYKKCDWMIGLDKINVKTKVIIRITDANSVVFRHSKYKIR